jgi:predicted MFS family arabinose efflux permease
MMSEKRILLLLAAVQFTNIVDFMIMMPMGDILKKQLMIGPGAYGVLVSSYGLAAGLSAFLGVFYLDNLDRKKALLWAYFGFMVGTLSSAIIPNTADIELNYYLFILTRVITGLTGGLLGGLVMSIVGDLIPLERRGRAMGWITMSFSLASVLGVPIALVLVDFFDHNWHVPFFVVSSLSLFIWIMVWRWIPMMKAHLSQQVGSFDRLATIRGVWQSVPQRNALLFTVLLVLGQFTVISFLTPYMINNVGLRQDQIKYIYITGGLATVLSGVAIGRSVDRWGRFRMFTIFAIMSCLTMLMNTHLSPVPLYVVLTIAGFFFIFISGRMIPANTIISAVVLPQQRAGFMSLNSAAQSLASGTSAMLAGAVITQESEYSPLQHYNVVGYIAVGCTLLALVIVRRIKKLSQIHPST